MKQIQSYCLQEFFDTRKKAKYKRFIDYELATIPTILFRNSMLRKSNKPSLSNSLPVKINPSSEQKNPKLCETDKGGFLHVLKLKLRVTRNHSSNNSSLSDSENSYVLKNYMFNISHFNG